MWCFEPACPYGPDGCHEPEIVASRPREHAWQIGPPVRRPPLLGPCPSCARRAMPFRALLEAPDRGGKGVMLPGHE